MEGDRAASSDEVRRLRLVVDQLPAMIGYWDRDLRNVLANHAYLEFFGQSPDAMRGRHIREILGEALFALNLPYIEGVLAGREQHFDRTLTDRHGSTRFTQASYLPDILDGEVMGFSVLVTDVSARVRAEQARDEARRLFEVSSAYSTLGEAILTTRGTAVYVNPALCTMFGYAAEDLIGKTFQHCLHPDHLDDARAAWERVISDRVSQTTEFVYLRRGGEPRWIQCVTAYVAAAQGNSDLIVAQFQDVTTRRRREEELARLALADSLTGTGNRQGFFEALDKLPIASTIGLIFVDIDAMKTINDVYGHSVGDAALVRTARRIAETVGPPVSVYRVGGDEFVVVIPDAEGTWRVGQLADQLRSALRISLEVGDVRVSVTASVGCTAGPVGEAEYLIGRADADMYRDKARRDSSRRP